MESARHFVDYYNLYIIHSESLNTTRFLHILRVVARMYNVHGLFLLNENLGNPAPRRRSWWIKCTLPRLPCWLESQTQPSPPSPPAAAGGSRVDSLLVSSSVVHFSSAGEGSSSVWRRYRRHVTVEDNRKNILHFVAIFFFQTNHGRVYPSL